MIKKIELLQACLDVLVTSEIIDFRNINDQISEVHGVTDKAALLNLPLIGEKEWLAFSIMRVSTKGEIWLKGWKYNDLFR